MYLFQWKMIVQVQNNRDLIWKKHFAGARIWTDDLPTNAFLPGHLSNL